MQEELKKEMSKPWFKVFLSQQIDAAIKGKTKKQTATSKKPAKAEKAVKR